MAAGTRDADQRHFEPIARPRESLLGFMASLAGLRNLVCRMESLPSNTDFAQLKAFTCVAEALNFRRAAERLAVTPSALSQTLKSLEARLGIRLLNRTTRSVSLTPAGIDLLERVKPSINHLGHAIEVAGRHRERIAGVVRIHAFRIAAEHFIKPMLRRFHDAYPDVILDVTLDDHVVEIVAGGFDAAIRVGEVIERDLVALSLGPELRERAVASPDYLARHGAPDHPRALAHHRCIGWRWPGQAHLYRWEFKELAADGKIFGVEVTGPLIANSRDFCVDAAVAGLGIAFAVNEAVAPDIAAGRLVPLLDDWSPYYPGFYLCYPSQRQMAPALRAFIDALRGAAAPT